MQFPVWCENKKNVQSACSKYRDDLCVPNASTSHQYRYLEINLLASRWQASIRLVSIFTTSYDLYVSSCIKCIIS